jgi:branched-chain amino acid aminotransferase
MTKGIRIRVSSFTRHHVNITMCRAKANGNYMNSMMALKRGPRDGYDEALLLDAKGFVMEGSGENIFIVRDGVLTHPGPDLGTGWHHPPHVIQLARGFGS